MKKLFWFAISLSSAFVVFCLVAFLCLVLSNLGNHTETTPKNTPSTVKPNAETVSVAVIFHDGSKTLLCDLEITPKLEKIKSHSIEINSNNIKFSENVNLNEGLYQFLRLCYQASFQGNLFQHCRHEDLLHSMREECAYHLFHV